MNPKLILCLALVLSGVLFGCSTAARHSVTAVTSEQNATIALSTLHVGMTMGEADKDLQRYSGIRVFTVGSAMRHCYHYFFIPDMNEVMLQFDEHDKLVSWEAGKKVQK
jgi:hypothetical protein